MRDDLTAGGGHHVRYLAAADVELCLPPLDVQLELAEQALRALAQGGAEMPPKVGVHPRPGALLHAMPAWLRGQDLVGLKWVSAFPSNNARGIPAINGLIVLNDAETGMPVAIIDAARITAVRTAAVTGVALRLFLGPDARRVAILGSGVQARSHLPVVAALLPGASVVAYDRHPERAERFADEVRRQPGVAEALTAVDPRTAVADADLIITVASLGSASQVMTPNWLAPGAVVIAVDFATYAAAELARTAALFAVDDRAQFLAYRDAGHFEGYPDPTLAMGEAIEQDPRAAGAAAPDPRGHILVTHLGVGLADVLFAEAVRLTAGKKGIGLLLPQ